MEIPLHVFILFAAFTVVDSQRYLIASPNVFRLNVDETISIQVWQTTKMEIYLQDQRRTKTISKVSKTFQPDKPDTIKMKITDTDLPKIANEGKSYFFLVAKGKGFQKEAQVLLDMRGGTVFIQTDKPIYSPREKVNYRVIPVQPDLLPMKQKVMIEITNPQGIRVRREKDMEAWKRGFEKREFDLGDIPVFGTWTITAYFSNKNVANSSTTFVVREYVLPTFQVRIFPPPYIAQTDKTIPIKVVAKYSFGKNVRGAVRLRLSILGKGKENVVLSDERAAIFGEEVFNIPADKLTEPKEIPSFPTGTTLEVLAAVTERATGTMEKAIDRTTILVKSPYIISFENTVKYFTPALSFRVHVNAYYPNKSPAKDVKLVFSATDGSKPLAMVVGSSNQAKTDENGKAFFTLNIPRTANDATRISVEVKTDMSGVENTNAKITLQPYKSAKRNYILIRTPEYVPKIGSRISIKVLIPFHSDLSRLNYLVLAAGRIVDQGIVRRNIGVETSFVLQVTAAMSPKCRVVVYYERKGEIAADSRLMDVEDGFKNKIKIKTDVESGEFHPALNFILTVENQKNSLIGLLGVDESVYYLRNKSRITKEKVFSDINKFDLGCGIGSGKDNKDVFDNAGLSIISSTPLTTTKRDALTCLEQNRNRKRRSIGNKAPVLLKKCCKGRCCIEFFKLHPTLQKNAKCKSLKDRILELCWEDFLQCCQRNFEDRGRSINSGDWEILPDDIDTDETQVTVRQFFPETWISMDQKSGDKGQTQLRFTVPDSITTWEVSAISVNAENGLGLSNILKLQSNKDVFIHIKMPFSVQRREQITVYAVIYNLNQQKTKVYLFLKGHSTFCSVAKPGQRSSKITVTVDGKGAFAVPFVIIPLTIGKIPIEFQAFTSDNNDRIIKELLVVPEGIQRQQVTSITLDPTGRLTDKVKGAKQIEVKGKNGNQINLVELTIPEEFVKGSELVTVYVTGNLMAASVEDIINGGLTNLIRLPTGCGEQTMIRLAPIVYVLKYLYSLVNGVTSEVEKKAYAFIRSGYNHELKWRRTDNSYSVWGERTPPSTWLSAFVNKVFCQARQYIKDDIDENIVCETLVFLESIQAADGSFPESYAVRHREMIGGVKSKLSLTAFVLISLMECKATCPKANARIAMKAASFLENQMSDLKSGYLMSLVAYSLSLANSPRKSDAYEKLTKMLTTDNSEARQVKYMKDGGPALSVEATSYALLTMMILEKTDSAGPLVIWLTKQRNAKGSFYSTQDTVIALQALSEYSSKTAGGELDLSIRVTSAKNKDIKRSFRITPDNALVRQQADITGALSGKVFIDTKGKGTAQLQIVTTYNQPSTKKEQCGYVIQITTKEGIENTLSDAPAGAKKGKTIKRKNKKCRRRGKNKKGKKRKKCRKTKQKQQKDKVANMLTVDICARHKFANGSSMTIIDAGLLTGFKPDEDSLKALLSKDKDPRIDHYEINDRSVIFYFRKISNQRKTCVQFITKRSFTVGDIQPVPVKVYDYYEPGDACTEFYGPKKGSQLLRTICDGDECQCSQGVCADEQTTNTKVLKKKACAESDFVFIGIVKEVEDLNSWQRIAMSIKRIYKRGGVDHAVGGKLHVYKSKSCVYPDFKFGDEYITMLKDSIKYVIDKDAFVLAQPTVQSKMLKLRTALDEVKQGDICDKI